MTICGGKYVYNTEKKVIYLPVKLENLPDEIKIKGYTLFKRSEFHVSLVCILKLIGDYNLSISDLDTKILNDFCEFVQTREIKLLNYKDEFKFVERDDKKTVVVMCEMSNLDEFFNFINQKYSLTIESPPAHVTLYTLDGKTGIYLITSGHIRDFTQPISNPIGHSL